MGTVEFGVETEPSHELCIDIDRVSAIIVQQRELVLDQIGDVEYELKEDGTEVTKLDPEIEEKIQTSLAMLYPDLGFWGEETGRHGSKENYFLCDPIDNTKGFIVQCYYSRVS